MNKIFLIKNQEAFQGEKYLNRGKNYFEGWYFKNSIGNDTVSFIPGINIENGNMIFSDTSTNCGLEIV